MVAQHSYDRRRGDRRRGSRSAYAGPERRTGRDRRGAQGRRGYDRRHSNGNGEERDYYYAGQKKQQNPMVYFGVAGGAILLIIIIAVAASGSGGGGGNRTRTARQNYGDVEDMERRARELVMQGGEAMQTAEAVLKESGQSSADPHFSQAYNYFQQAHDLYEDLDRRFPETRFYHALQDLERNMYEVQRKRGTGDM
jgi:hypothetical protein